MAGYIYILGHSSKTSVKVGETRVSPESRAEGYSSVYKLKGFRLQKTYVVPEGARKDVEKRAHSKLQEYQLSGISGAREIFSCSVEEAAKAIEEAIEESDEVEKQKRIEHEKRELEKKKRKKRREKLKKRNNLWKESNDPLRKEFLENEVSINRVINFLEKWKNFDSINLYLSLIFIAVIVGGFGLTFKLHRAIDSSTAFQLICSELIFFVIAGLLWLYFQTKRNKLATLKRKNKDLKKLFFEKLNE